MKTVALYASQPCQKEFLQQFEKLTERQLVYVLENQATQAGLDVSLLTQGGVDIVVEALQNPQQADQVIQAGLNAGITVVATNIAALNRACDVYQNTALDKGAVFITAGAVWGDGRAYLGHLQSESQRLFLLPGGASSTLLNYMRDEISYIHAEAYPAGEMKHGPIALVDDTLPVINLACAADGLLEKTLSNMQEVHARGGQIILVGDQPALACAAEIECSRILVPQSHPAVAPMLFTVPLQQLAYRVALLKGTDVDQPRNLAKSVTVE